MISEDQTAVSDASEQPEPEGEGVEQPVSQDTSFADALLEVAKAEGHIIGDTPEPPAEAEAQPKPEESETVQEEKEAEPSTQPVEAEHKSIEDQIVEAKAKGEKPPWYLSRIAEESDKKRKALEDAGTVRLELAKAKEEAQALQSQLQAASGPRPTPDNPLIDVYDEPKLQQLKGHYEKVLKFATLNPNGAVDAVIGKDKDGNEIRRDFTPEEIAEMHYGADKALRDDIPQRRAFIAQRAQADAQAVDLYPQLKQADDPFTQTVLSVLKANPMLETVLGPEVTVWISHALKGREITLGGRTTENGSTQRIVTAAKTKIAPTPTRERSQPERRSSSVTLDKTARKFEARGDKESAEDYVGALLARKSGSSRVEPIGE